VALPDTLWFSFPRRFCDYVTGEVNGFAAALLPLAMTLDEDLYMEGALSPRLLNGMEEYQRLQCSWHPSPFQPVRLEPEILQPTIADSGGGGVGCSFSGGVDSAHTLWRHLPENERNPAYRISHCIIINGFDANSDIDSPGSFSRIEPALQPMMGRIGTQLIVCRTNYMAFIDPRILKQSFAAVVTAPALVLGGLLSVFYVPSSYRFDDFFRDGSHPILDHLIATETMETIHDSPHVKRTEKTEAISRWSETYSTLRVCGYKTGYHEKTNSIQNCGRCEKCIRTIKTLELYGRLEKYQTFRRKPSRLDVWMCPYGFKGSRIFAKEIISEAFKVRRFGILIDYCIAIVVSGVFKFPRFFVRKIHLFIEDRSDTYAKWIRRLFPRLREKYQWIKPQTRI